MSFNLLTDLTKTARPALEVCCCFNYFAWYFVYGPGLLLLFIILSFTPLFFIPCLYAVWWFYDKEAPFRAGHHSKFARGLCLWRYVASYFPMALHKTVDLDASKNYILVHHPHALFAFSNVIHFATEATGFSEKFPGITVHPLTLDMNFYVPVMRDVILSCGVASCGARSMMHKLTKLGSGQAVALVVGGTAEAEIFDHNDPYRLKLRERKGFIKIALRTGTPLVPTFSFGETGIFHEWKPSPGSLFSKVRSFTHRNFGFVPVIPGGRLFFLPFRHPIHTVVGEPMHVPLIPEPKQHDIDKYHRLYIHALKKLFNENVKIYGDPSKKLVIL